MAGLSQVFANAALAIGLIFFCAIGFSILLVLLLKRCAIVWNLVDRPDQTRKLHDSHIPLIGGIAVFLGAILGMGVSVLFFPEFWSLHVSDKHELLGLALASSFLLLVGVIDDRFNLRGRQKLAGQIGAALILVIFGYTFHEIMLFGHTFSIGLLAIPLAIAWILGTVNSVNLIDGADGIASTVGIIIGAAITFTAMWHERFIDAAIAAALTGGLVAFLYFNLPKASAFLGDAGSMLIGLVFGAIAIRCAFKQSFAYCFAAPIAILAIPFLDVFVAIVRRAMTGRSIYTTDREHLHHTLLRTGMSQRSTLLAFSGLTLLTGICGTICVFTRNESIAIFGVITIVVILVSFRIFGFSEFSLFKQRIVGLLRSIFIFQKDKQTSRHHKTHLQGSCNWDVIWSTAVEFSEKHDLTKFRLDLNLPWVHESYNATWKQAGQQKPEKIWHLRLPLTVNQQACGRIEVSGVVENGHHDTLRHLTMLSESIEESLAQLSFVQSEPPIPETQSSEASLLLTAASDALSVESTS